MTDMPIMRAAFRTTVSGDGKYEMVFRFPSMDAMHAADDEWRAAPVEAVAWICAADVRALQGKPEGDDLSISPRPRPDLGMNTPLYTHPPEPAASTVAQGEG